MTATSARITAESAGPEVVRRASAAPRVAAVGLGLGALSVAALLLTTPWGGRNATGYDDIAPIRDAAWAGMLADGIAFAVVGFTLAITVLFLVRGKGRVLALIGAVVTTLGGLLFAMGSFSFASLAWYATSPAVPVEAGRALVAYATDNPQHGFVVVMIGFLLYTVGSIVLAVALIRGRVMPIVGVVAFLALTVAQFVGLEGRLLDVAQIAQMLLLAGLAAWSLRRS